MNEASCSTCRYFHTTSNTLGDNNGVCRRFPPPNNEAKGPYFLAPFPRVGARQWCGEFRSKTQHSLEAGGPW